MAQTKEEERLQQLEGGTAGISEKFAGPSEQETVALNQLCDLPSLSKIFMNTMARRMAETDWDQAEDPRGWSCCRGLAPARPVMTDLWCQ
ncbi:hypothetical protein ElyMa_005873600 [Elysia marginata]|uniref:Uncharacterized protein n=1 Tax=Elysia marginata TaxID=1093978 RepID=A0AAV4G1I1_9GAST|nr:hypothetical protein ElyMa_005873600 [Elysia marginata]